FRWFQAGERLPGKDLHLPGCVRSEAHRAPRSARAEGVTIQKNESRMHLCGLSSFWIVTPSAADRKVGARAAAVRCKPSGRLRFPPFLRSSVFCSLPWPPPPPLSPGRLRAPHLRAGGALTVPVERDDAVEREGI